MEGYNISYKEMRGGKSVRAAGEGSKDRVLIEVSPAYLLCFTTRRLPAARISSLSSFLTYVSSCNENL